MERMLDGICYAMEQSGAIDPKQHAVIRYGLDLLIFSLFSLAGLLLAGIGVGRGSETAIMLVTFIPLQSFGGGYHCQTHARCFLMMLSVLMVSLLIRDLIPAVMMWSIGAVSAIPIFRLAPVQHPKAPFSEGFRKRMRAIVRSCYMAAIGVSVYLYAVGGEYRSVLMAVILSGVSICCATVQQKRID